MDKQTIKIQISCGIGVRYLIETTTKIEDIIGYDALFNSLQKCKKGVGWKSTTGYYIHNWNTELLKMEEELSDGTYQKRKPKFLLSVRTQTSANTVAGVPCGCCMKQVANAMLCMSPTAIIPGPRNS